MTFWSWGGSHANDRNSTERVEQQARSGEPAWRLARPRERELRRHAIEAANAGLFAGAQALQCNDRLQAAVRTERLAETPFDGGDRKRAGPTTERACQTQVTARAGGAKLRIPAPEVAAKTAAQFKSLPYKPKRPEWKALLRMLDRTEPSYKT